MKDKDRILFIRENLLAITQDDLRLDGCRLSRKEVARILGYTAEAVRGWDRRKRAPGKVRWIPGTSIGKAVFYDIKQALPAMQQIFKRNANREHSRKMALLLYAQNKMK